MKKIFIIIIAITSLVFYSCDDFLDKVPDNRTELNTPKKLKNLLNTCYPNTNYGVIGELSSDNMWDNRVPYGPGLFYKVEPFDQMDIALFSWQDITLIDRKNSDSPYAIWDGFYHSIAAANLILESIREMEEGTEYTKKETDPYKGEALALRAYCHFILVNIFAQPYKDANASKNDMAIPYVTVPASNYNQTYERLSVAEVYDLILKDIYEALPLIDNEVYKNPSYHFNKQALHAFAAKVNLYVRDYEKVVEHADLVLGLGDPTQMLRKWEKLESVDQYQRDYFDANSEANLLLILTNSLQQRRMGNRFGYTRDHTSKGYIMGAGPTWSGRPGWLYERYFYFGSNQELGSITPQGLEFFEYTDKVARIGYPHIMRAEFTTNALLLDRAEAKVFLDKKDEALKDLDYWSKSHNNKPDLTESNMQRYYSEDSNSSEGYWYPFNTEKLSSDFTVTEEQKLYIDCVLHFRRLDKMYTGDRWFDIKRYGIELTKKFSEAEQTITLRWDSPQRAIKIPTEVINSGSILPVETVTQQVPNI